MTLRLTVFTLFVNDQLTGQSLFALSRGSLCR